MDESTLAALIDRIAGEDFSNGKMRVLRDGASARYFLAEQVARILPLFDMENDRLNALQLLAPRILDRQNGFTLYGLFKFENSKRQVERILSQ